MSRLKRLEIMSNFHYDRQQEEFMSLQDLLSPANSSRTLKEGSPSCLCQVIKS